MDQEIINQILSSHFSEPIKCINSERDMSAFQKTRACTRIISLIHALSQKVTLKKRPQSSENPSILKLSSVFDQVDTWITETPPLEGPRRFGNLAFRTFHDKLIAQSNEVLKSTIGLVKENMLLHPEEDPYIELTSYFLGAFGSRQRLDFGTGHELSFLAFFGGLWSLDLVSEPSGEDILFIFERYFKTIRELILRYNLEPAGSHGVWGLDDHFHLPYILGSAQIVNINEPDTPTPRFPPKSILRRHVVERERDTNLYFSAIDFIYTMKRGPFHEHSPILYDVTGVATWHKIHRGMVKMYIAEVLGKFPVVQHFWFGDGLYPWVDAEGNKLPISEEVEDQSPALNNEYLRFKPSGTGIPGLKAPWAMR